MFIEDLLHKLQLHCKVNRYDSGLVNSFLSQIFSGLGFTEKQSVVAVKIIKRYAKNLSSALNVDILPFLNNPTFKNTIRKPNYLKKISIVDYWTWGQAIKVEFPYDGKKIDAIRQHKDSSCNFIQWDGIQKSWMFSLNEGNIQFLITLIDKEEFDIDPQFQEYIDQAKKVLQSIEKHVPMITMSNNLPVYCNVSRYVPMLTTANLIDAIFEARKAGIFTWDESVTDNLNKLNLNSVTRNFISNEILNIFDIDSGQYPIEYLEDIVKYSCPILFVIPSGDEIKQIKLIYNFLTNLGFTHDQMSVMFRLSNVDGKDFNNFIKTCSLNNPVTDKTKFVFISTKMPKPVIKSGLHFNATICLGKQNFHHTIREYLRNKENIIVYSESKKQREFTFGDLQSYYTR